MLLLAQQTEAAPIPESTFEENDRSAPFADAETYPAPAEELFATTAGSNAVAYAECNYGGKARTVGTPMVMHGLNGVRSLKVPAGHCVNLYNKAGYNDNTQGEMLAIHGPVSIQCLSTIQVKGSKASWLTETSSYKMGPCPSATTTALATSAVKIAADATGSDLTKISDAAANAATDNFGSVTASSTRAGKSDGVAFPYDEHPLTRADLQVMGTQQVMTSTGMQVGEPVSTEPVKVAVAKTLFKDTAVAKVTTAEEDEKDDEDGANKTADAKTVAPVAAVAVKVVKTTEEKVDDDSIAKQKIYIPFPGRKSEIESIDDPEDLVKHAPNKVGCDPNVGCPQSGAAPEPVVKAAFKKCGYTCMKDPIKHVILDHKLCMKHPDNHACKACLACAFPIMTKATGVDYTITRPAPKPGEKKAAAKVGEVPPNEGAISADASTSGGGHYYIGAGRRRVGAGFGRRRTPYVTPKAKAKAAMKALPAVKSGAAEIVKKTVIVPESPVHPFGKKTVETVVPVTIASIAEKKADDKAKAAPATLPVVNVAKPSTAAVAKVVAKQAAARQAAVTKVLAKTAVVKAEVKAAKAAPPTEEDKRKDAATEWAEKVEAKAEEKVKADETMAAMPVMAATADNMPN